MEEVTLTRIEADELKKQLVEMSGSICREHFAFSAMLYMVSVAQIQVGKEDNFIPVWKAWGHTSYEEFVERDVGVHYSTAHSNCKMHYVFFVFCAGQFDIEKLYALGITRARELSKVVRPSNVKSMMNKAATVSCCELKEIVDYMIKGKNRRGRLQGYHCTMRRTQVTKVKQAVCYLKEQLGMDNTGDVIAKSVLEYAAILQSKPKLRRKMKLVAA